jgi:NADH-quinone oxidoreductase subunit D
MSADELLQKAESLLAGFAKGTARPEPNRLDAVIQSSDLVATTTALRRAGWGFLSALTGVDLGKDANQIEALYHVCEGDAIATLRVTLPRTGGAVPTVQAIYPNALFFERELMEMFGVTVKGLADTSHLYLPDGWPEGTYPLLKDTDVRAAAAKTMGSEPPEMGRHGDRFIVPVGPQHPALKEPGHFEFAVDGELVTGATVRLGYVHRGIERACEQQNYTQNLYLVERVCGICSHSHANAYVNGVEKLAKIEAPPRAQTIRQLVACLERIHSHYLWLGVAAHEAGFETLLMYSWRDREVVMDILEQMTGNRVNYSASILGGVKYDVTAAHAATIRRGMDKLEERTKHYLHVVTADTSFLARAQGIGVTSKEEADALGLLGPTLRAAGVPRDVRVDAPYGSYKQFPVTAIVDSAGDLAARFKVRMLEVLESIRVIRAILDGLPEGDLSVKFPRKIPAGEAISRFEAPRGELFYFIKSNGTDTPERVKIRTPSICNWIYVLKKAVGSQMADVPPLLAGIDPCFSCNDRMIVVNRRGGDRRIWTREDLRRHANTQTRR